MNPLTAVVTIPEACKLYYVARSTVIYHIDRGNLEWRLADRTYLITLDSLIQLWGHPPKIVADVVQHSA